MKTDVAVVAGSFDPITIGHEDLIKRAAKLFSTVYVVIGVNSDKKYMFDLDQRLEMLSSAFEGEVNIIPTVHDGLIAEFAKEKGAVIVKGLRYATDFDYEHLQAESNYMISGVDTVFLSSRSEDTYITSSLVRELIKASRPFEKYVSANVAERIKLYTTKEFM